MKMDRSNNIVLPRNNIGQVVSHARASVHQAVVGTSFGWDIVHHRSGAGGLAAYRQTLQLVSLIPVVAVVFICGLSDVLIKEYLFIYLLFMELTIMNF